MYEHSLLVFLLFCADWPRVEGPTEGDRCGVDVCERVGVRLSGVLELDEFKIDADAGGVELSRSLNSLPDADVSALLLSPARLLVDLAREGEAFLAASFLVFADRPVDFRLDKLLDLGRAAFVGLADRLARDLEGLRSTLAAFLDGARFFAPAWVELVDRRRDRVVLASMSLLLWLLIQVRRLSVCQLRI